MISPNIVSFYIIIKTPLFHYPNIDLAHPIKLSNKTNSDRLTTLESGDTPTLNDGKSPTIKALAAAQAAHDDAAFELVVARMPTNHRIRISHVHYVLYDPYRPRKSKRKAWY